MSAIFRWDTFSLILNAKLHFLFVDRHRDQDAGSFGAMLQRVQQDVRAEQKRVAAIDLYLGICGRFELDLNRFQFGQRLALMYRILNGVEERTRLGRGFWIFAFLWLLQSRQR